MLGFLKSFTSNIHYKYSVSSRPAFEAGCWTVFDAKHKTTNDPVSVFVFSKKVVADLLTQNGIRPRSAVVNEVWEFATRGVHQLTKIRHPAVLKLVEPLESSKTSMTFVTERVVGTLNTLHESDLDELSVVRGLTSVVQALEFLHSQLGLVHGNIFPTTIFADLQGDWKIAGLEFVVNFAEAGSYHLPMLDPRMPGYMHPSYDYLAPELVLNQTVVPANDVWSIACILYYIYQQRRSPLNTRNNPSAYKEELARLQTKLQQPQQTNKFPKHLQPYLASLFCVAPEGRMTLSVLETTDFFQNPLIKALKAMDEYAAKPVEEKVSFLKHFQTLLPQFPKQMRVRKIVKFATKELAGPRDPATATLLGNVLFQVSADMSKLSFQEQVLPVFTQLAEYFPFQESVVNNIATITRNTNDKDFSKSVLPVLLDTLKLHDAQHAPVQTRLLNDTELFAPNVTIAKLEQSLFPAVIDCFAGTPAKQVKTAATASLGVLVHRGVSKSLITDRLIPALQAMKTRDPTVVVSVVKLWNEVSAKLNSAQVFTLALPNVLELSLAKQLTVDQFKQIMAVVREQIDTTEREQLKTLVHNQVHDEDDWLSEPPQTVSQSVPQLAPQSAPASAQPAVAPLPKTKQVPPVPAPAPAPLIAKPLAAQRTQKLPDLPKPTPTNTLSPQPRTPSASLMPALIPTSNTSSMNAFTPLQPQKPKQQQQQSEFGAFTSTPSSSQFDSLI